jgi:hypothetical protein
VQPSAERFAICRAVLLRLPIQGRYLGPGRRREVRAEWPGGPAGRASETSALRLTEVRRQAASFPQRAVRQQAVSFRRPAARRLADRGVAADHPEVSSSRRQGRAALLRQDARALSVLRRQEVSKALQRPEAWPGMV